MYSCRPVRVFHQQSGSWWLFDCHQVKNRCSMKAAAPKIVIANPIGVDQPQTSTRPSAVLTDIFTFPFSHECEMWHLRIFSQVLKILYKLNDLCYFSLFYRRDKYHPTTTAPACSCGGRKHRDRWPNSAPWPLHASSEACHNIQRLARLRKKFHCKGNWAQAMKSLASRTTCFILNNLAISPKTK